MAYEPVWAIGTGNDCQPEEASEMIRFIKYLLNSKFHILNSRVIYGGSVDSQDIADYLKYPEIEGALVGGASLGIEEFKKLSMKRLSQLKPSQLQNKICLLRVDLNIEFEEKDAFRLQAILPTIKFLIKNGAKVAILSHRGRPPEASSVKRQASGYTLRPFAKIISELLKKPVHFIDYNVFQKLKAKLKIHPPAVFFFWKI